MVTSLLLIEVLIPSCSFINVVDVNVNLILPLLKVIAVLE